MSRREMYPAIEPFDTGFLQVSDLHRVYFEQCGNKNGNPVLFLHGGPGSGFTPRDRQFFDPVAYRVILMDQRGAGKSTPTAELKENTTWHVVADLEKLRDHLGIDKWIVFGGSWGCTLALVYAQAHPSKVKGIIIRGIYTCRRRELLWIYQDGACSIFPDIWEDFIAPIPEAERGDILGAYYRRLTGDDQDIKSKCAKSWNKWGTTISSLHIYPDKVLRVDEGYATIGWYCHYLANGMFLKSDGELLDPRNLDKIRHIPTTIIQGRYDILCPMETACHLHRALPEAEFHVVPDAGHSSFETGIQTKLLEACDKYKKI